MSQVEEYILRPWDEFNPPLLRIARQARRMKQPTLAKLAKINQGYLSRIEHGLLVPKREIVQRFAKILEFPESYFYQTDRVYGLPLSVHGSTGY